MKRNKKGISPLIATVLVIGFTIVLAGVVLKFLMPLFTDATENVQSEAALMNLCSGFSTSLAVRDAKFTVGTTSPKNKLDFTIDNSGNGAVRDFIVKIFTQNGNAGSCNLIANPATSNYLEAGGVSRVTLTTTTCADIVKGTATDKIVRVELTPRVYSTTTQLTSPCPGSVIVGSVY